MVNCEHCGRDTIGLSDYLWSGPTRPAKCRACGGLSYRVKVRSRAAIRAANIPFIVMVVLILISTLLPRVIAWAVAIIGMCSYTVLFVYFYCSLPMVPTTQAEVIAGKRWERVGLSLVAIAVLGIIAYGVSRAI